MKKTITLILLVISMSSCEILSQVATMEPTSTKPDTVAGLKEALNVGAKLASRELGSTDGYFGSELYKILLPPNLQAKIDGFKQMEIDVFGITQLKGTDLYSFGNSTLGIRSLQELEDDLILGINRAAEEAANEAVPIFATAISGITFSDANNILFGGRDDAATEFLKSNTYTQLFSTYEPKLSNAISSVQVNNRSVEDIYSNYVNEYNKIVSKQIPVSLLQKQTIGELANLTPLDMVDISEHATNKGLDGLFLRVEQEEGNIRNNVVARVSQILKDVFGQLDQ